MSKKLSSDNPTAGIIVPIYNTAKYIERCLISILNNTYSNIKVFCIDDGSKDESPAIVEKIAKNDSRVILIRQENSGVSAARNRGLEAACEENCEVIGFVDSDDWVHPQYIEILLSGILDGYDVSVCNWNETDRYSEDFNIIISKSYVELEFEKMDEKRVARTNVWCHLYRSECIKNIRFCTDICYGEDSLFNFMFFNYSNKACYINEKLYYYFQRSDSAVHTVSAKDVICYAKRLLLHLQNKTLTYSVKKICILDILKITFSTRYLYSFDADFLETDSICKDLLNEMWRIVTKDKIKFKGMFAFKLFSAFPSLYRLFRILTDRTLLKWEKQQKNKRRSIN